IEPGEGVLQIEPLPCAVAGHDQAHAIAEALHADVVVWAGACGEGGGAAAPDVCPSAAFHHESRGIRQPGEAGAAVREETDIELPPLRPDAPLPLVHFLMGVSFSQRARAPVRRGELRLAARFLRFAAEGTDLRAPHREEFELPVALAASASLSVAPSPRR